MGKIVAIGGGEIGRPKKDGGFYPVETTAIDKEIIRLSGKKNPRMLFIPTASKDSAEYYEVITKHFGKRLGCKCDALYLIKDKPTKKEMRSKILNADIIYVGGGNTFYMINIWRRLGVDKLLYMAYKKDIVLSGISAGAICWFRYCTTDSRPKLGKSNHSFSKMGCLDFVNLTVSPHHILEPNRKPALINIMKKTPGVGIALDDYTALEILGDTYRIITSKKTANVNKVFFKNRKLSYIKLNKNGKFRPLSELYSK